MKQELSNYLNVLRTRNVMLITVINFLCSLTFHNVVFTLFLLSKSFNYTQIFFLETVLSMAVFAFEVPSGFLADKFGRKKILVFAALCGSVSMILEATGVSYIAFILAAVISGVSLASISGTDSALIYESLKMDKKDKSSDYAFSLINGANSAGLFIALPIGGLLAQHTLSLPVYVSCIPLAMAPIVALFLKETNNLVVENEKEKKEQSTGFKDTLKNLVRNHSTLLIVVVVNALSFVIILSLHYLNQPVLKSFNVDYKYFGWIMLVASLISILIGFLSPWLKRKISLASVLFISLIVPGLSLILISQSTSLILSLIALIAALSFKALGTPLIRSVINEHISDFNRATTLSVIGFIGSVIGMSTKPLLGRLVDFNLTNTILILGIVMSIISLIMYFSVGKLNKKQVDIEIPLVDKTS